MADQVQGASAPPSPAGPAVPLAPHAPQGWPFVHLNWSNFKPEFSGKPDEDAEAHLLCTNDWMDTPNFIDEVKNSEIFSNIVG